MCIPALEEESVRYHFDKNASQMAEFQAILLNQCYLFSKGNGGGWVNFQGRRISQHQSQYTSGSHRTFLKFVWYIVLNLLISQFLANVSISSTNKGCEGSSMKSL